MVGNRVGDWNYNDGYLLCVGEDKKGSFVCGGLSGRGEVGMCMKGESDWWGVEFRLKDGERILYGENNGVNNGWRELGEEYCLGGNRGEGI